MTMKCQDCGALEGSLHNRECPREICPFCFGQATSCMCRFRAFGFKPQHSESEHPTMGLPRDVFLSGLSKEQEEQWGTKVDAKGRIPFFCFPWICMRCGSVDPPIFMVSDEEWKAVVPRDRRDGILCRPCFDEMKQLLAENS